MTNDNDGAANAAPEARNHSNGNADHGGRVNGSGAIRAANEEQAADEKAMLAAEYALGTLDADDRANVQMLMAIDPGFATAVAEWERRLGELHALVSPVEPPPATWDWVKARIAAEPQAAKLWLPPVEEPVGPPQPRQPQTSPEELIAAPVALWRRRARKWQAATVAAAAAALLFLTGAVLREAYPDIWPEPLRPSPRVVEKEIVVETVREVPSQQIAQYVAMLQKDSAAPGFTLTIDLSRGVLSVRRLAAQQQSGKDYELWLMSDKFPGPRSLGIVGDQEYTVRREFTDYDAPALNAATYAVSLEPSGGSSTGAPTGPVLFTGKLVQTTPPAFPTPAP